MRSSAGSVFDAMFLASCVILVPLNSPPYPRARAFPIETRGAAPLDADVNRDRPRSVPDAASITMTPAVQPQESVADIIARHEQDPVGSCLALRPVLEAAPAKAAELIPYAISRPQWRVALAGCLVEIYSFLKVNDPAVAKAMAATIISAPTAFQAIFAIALAKRAGPPAQNAVAHQGIPGDGLSGLGGLGFGAFSGGVPVMDAIVGPS